MRAGQPWRTIDLPGAAVVGVSPEGQRVEITLTSAQIEQFAGAGSTGAGHLAAQQEKSQIELASTGTDARQNPFHPA